jgi:hypothetical protein
MVVAELSPHDAWQQPLFRLADITIGVGGDRGGVDRPALDPTLARELIALPGTSGREHRQINLDNRTIRRSSQRSTP